MLRRLALCALALSCVGLPLALSTSPASAAGPLRLVRTMDRTLSTYYPTLGTSESFSTPAVGDITGDGTPETVVAGNDGNVFAYRADGSVLWYQHVANAAIEASPALADVGGDGRSDVVIGAMDGSVVWLDGPSGIVAQRFWDTPSLACQPGVYCKPRGFFATPAVADLDGDGRPEVVAASWDHQLYAWRRDGSTLFRRFLEDTLWSSPVVADLDADGQKEIILGGDRYADATHPSSGYLWVLRANGSNFPGYPKLLPGQTIWSSPAVADLNDDHRLDIVFGTGLNFADPAGHLVYAYTGSTGTALPGWPVTTPGRVMASPAVADLNGDGKRDVVVGTEGGYLEAFSGTGARMWAVCNAYAASACGPGYPTHGQATIADIDQDGVLDVVSAMDKHLRVFRGSDGALERESVLGSPVNAPPSAATIAQVGGSTWIVQNAVVEANGQPGRNSGDVSRTWVFTTDTGLGAAPWPTFHRDAARSGYERAGTEGWYPLSSPQAFVTQQYLDFLGRAPDASGLSYWSGLLTSGRIVGSGMIVQFLNSAEFGRVLAPVVRVHFGLFGAAPSDYQQLVGQMARSRQGVTPAQIADEMIAADPQLQAQTDTAFVTAAYRNSWGAPPNSQQLSDARGRLAAGATRGQVLVGITESPWPVAVLSSRVNVLMTYVGMLRRLPDAGGYTYWVGQVDNGVSLTKLTSLFQFSSEYYNRFH